MLQQTLELWEALGPFHAIDCAGALQACQPWTRRLAVTHLFQDKAGKPGTAPPRGCLMEACGQTWMHAEAVGVCGGIVNGV